MSRLPGRGAFASLVARALANAARSSSRRVASGPAFSTRPPRALAAAAGDAVAASTAAAAAAPSLRRGVFSALDHHRGGVWGPGRDASSRDPVVTTTAWPRAPRVVELPDDHAPGALDPWRAPRDDAFVAAAHTDAAHGEPPRGGEPPPGGHPADTTTATTAGAGSSSGAGSSQKNNTTPPFGSEDADRRMYHFEVRGADAKSKVDPAMIKCMCHEVARAHARRTAEAQRRAASSSAAAAPNRSPSSDAAARASAAAAHASDPDDFCVFSHTVMRDILEAKHSKLSFWGATHWCDASDTVTKAIRQMTEADVGALLVMNRRAMDLDDNDVIDEHELRASPESGAIKGIITERDYLRAVALGNVRWHTKVAEVMTDFESAPEKLVSVAPDTSVLAAMEIMTEQRIRHIPCIAPAAKDGSRGAKMEGIVTIGDVVKALLSEEREEVQVCRDYISGNFDHYA